MLVPSCQAVQSGLVGSALVLSSAAMIAGPLNHGTAEVPRRAGQPPTPHAIDRSVASPEPRD